MSRLLAVPRTRLHRRIQHAPWLRPRSPHCPPALPYPLLADTVTLIQEEITMLAMWVKVRVKPAERQRFLEAIEHDALGSERDEPGCLRFNVLQDANDENVYYFFEVYKDQAALEAHRAMPHYAVWRAAADTLDGPAELTPTQTVFPADRAYWGKA